MRLILLLACLVIVSAGETPRTGTYTTTFTERHPESLPERFGLRYGNLDEARKEAYDITKEEFEINVPGDYDGTVPYGLIVYTNAGKGGYSGAYAGLLAKHRLIWIGANNVPNERSIVPRWGLSLDAVWNMSKRYRIDPRRIYASGFSGGGRCASMVVPTFADVFSGAIYLCGCNPPVWPPEKLVGKPIHELAINARYALVTGDKDMNQPGTKALFENYKSQGFKHVTYLEQPGLGHDMPAAEWFEKALVFVDQPLVEEAKGLLAQAKPLDAKKPYEACRLYRQVIDGFPIAADERAAAQERFTALAPQVDELLRGELAKLGTATSDKQRAFVQRAAGFPCEAEARTLAEAGGDKELTALLAQSGATQAGKLEKFMTVWSGFACADKALEAYDGLAAKAFETVSALAEGKRAKPLAKFLKDWSACPTRSKAVDLLETELSTELDAILALDKPQAKGQKLTAFCKAWPETVAGARAEAALKDLIKK